jgi:Ca-activated chloride channel homolog
MNPTRFSRIILAAACVSLIGRGAAESRLHPPGEARSQTISVDVNLIVLSVSVEDRRGQRVSGLERERFQVYEDDQKQEVTLFEGQDAPAIVGVLIDNSSSMRPKLGNTVAAARSLVHLSNPADYFFVIHFNDQLSLGLEDGTRFSSDRETLVRAVDRISPAGTTALYDAVAAGIDHAETGSLDKRVLVVISDGADNASRRSLDSVVRKAQGANVIIDTVGLYARDSTDRDPKALRALANQTGGVAFFPSTIDAVTDVAEEIAAGIRSEYTLGYVSTNRKRDGSFRRIRVTVPSVPQSRIHTRPGYIAPLSSAEGPAIR